MSVIGHTNGFKGRLIDLSSHHRLIGPAKGSVSLLQLLLFYVAVVLLCGPGWGIGDYMYVVYGLYRRADEMVMGNDYIPQMGNTMLDATQTDCLLQLAHCLVCRLVKRRVQKAQCRASKG